MPTIQTEQLTKIVHQVLRQWHRAEFTPDTAWTQLISVQSKLPNANPTAAQLQAAVRQVVQAGLARLEVREPELGLLLRLRFIDRQTIIAVAHALHVSVDTTNRKQRKALEELAAQLLAEEQALWEAASREITAVLPPPTYTRLFGYDRLRQTLVHTLVQSGEPWLMTIQGIGGIGKSALADASVREAIQQASWQGLHWVRVEPSSMSGKIGPEAAFDQILTGLGEQSAAFQARGTREEQQRMLRSAFKAGRYLVVVDNIEDAVVLNYVAARLRDWSGPSKFLITTRSVPVGEQSWQIYSLNELPLEDSLALLRHEAAQWQLEELVAAPDAELTPILDLVGGNPLALKLTIGLARAMPFDVVLAELTSSGSRPVDDMYRHIYWQAWRSLDEDARTLLESMPLVGESGALPEQMQAVSELQGERFWQAVRTLVSRSLLEVRGTVWQRRYGIHRLTETFLQLEIIGWSSWETHD